MKQAFSLLFVLLVSMVVLFCSAKSIDTKKDITHLETPKYPNINGRLAMKLKPEHLVATKQLFSERLAGGKTAELPKTYDPREKYPQCFHIYNQQYCGSCWANAVAGAFSDRICLASK
eukprot:Nk52_evm1s1639 gene=Nk52_evmTU1s1639